MGCQRFLQQCAEAEDAHCDPGANLGEQLGTSTSWSYICQKQPRSAPGVLLSLMGAQHEWIWSLPWTAPFRLYLTSALLLLRPATLSSEESASLEERPLLATYQG